RCQPSRRWRLAVRGGLPPRSFENSAARKPTGGQNGNELAARAAGPNPAMLLALRGDNRHLGGTSQPSALIQKADEGVDQLEECAWLRLETSVERDDARKRFLALCEIRFGDVAAHARW